MASEPKPPCILMIEDSEEDYEATTRAFGKVSLCNPVFWCRSGTEGLDFLERRGPPEAPGVTGLPGLILLDLNMAGLDGHKTLKIIKANEDYRRIPVIILTTSGNERDVTSCYEAGANTYVQKPLSFEGLIEAIRRMKEFWFEVALLPKGGESVG
jgi:two-component system, response regulator